MKLSVRTLAWLLVTGLTTLSGRASAHHSYAMFDQARRLSVEGTVRAVEWTNPHVWVWVDVGDGKGATAPYGFEAQGPSELQRFFGWTNTSLKRGERITVEYAPLRSGKNGGALRTITFSDGRHLLTARSNAPPGPFPAAGAQPEPPR